MVEKYCGGVVPAGAPVDLDAADAADIAEYHAALDGRRGRLLHEGLKRVMATVARGNEFVQTSQPWALAKDPGARDRLDTVLAAIVRQLARQAILLFPFMPGKTQELWQQLGGAGAIADQRFSGVETLDVTGWRVTKGAGLFPKKQGESRG
jgi:methionyl-tRNA synthetase